MSHDRAPADPSIRATAGHFTDGESQTGCTVVLFDHPAMTVVDVRGGAPGTRETDLLAPGRLVRRADAILLTGGSAFGLAAADGVMRFLAERRRGVVTRTGPVPIVPSAVVYDLAVGRPEAPGSADGQSACEAAVPIPELTRGRVGAGAGATTGKLSGTGPAGRGGLGTGHWWWNMGHVTAVAVVNSFGHVLDADTCRDQRTAPWRAIFADEAPVEYGRESTTLAVVLVDAPVDHSTLVLCAIAAHDAMARTIQPSHTIFDGDVAFAAALRESPGVAAADALKIGAAAGLAVEHAIRDAVAVDRQ